MQFDTEEKILQRAASILKQYVPQVNESKFKDYLRFSALKKNVPIRYIMFEDHNVSAESPSIIRYKDEETEYPAHFREDKSLVELWEEDYFDCGCTLDDLYDETRDGYLGLLDLVEGKYLRVNGHGDSYEFGDGNAPDGQIDWSEWFK